MINAVNLQYESEVGLTHQITTIIVRNVSDPYTSLGAQSRLCQFITEWTNNQQSVVRDVAHLFTGVDLSGTTIGIASDIGGTGICVNQGGCSGGTFGTFGSYCLSQSDFTSSFACKTDLTAHELGHLWGAFHCSCSSFTMNASITCANQFSAGTINSITAYRDTRTCLSGTCDSGGPTAPENDLCGDATLIPCNTQEVINTADATPSLGSSDPQLPFGSPSCQWQGQPANAHNTVWYEFIADDTSIEIQTCSTTAIQDTIIALYDGSCGSLVELACGEDECGSTTYMSSLCYNGLVPGNAYLFMVGNPGGWSGSIGGNTIIDVACPCPSVGPVAGACCLPSGACIGPVTSGTCAASGGTFQGAGTDCGGVVCGPPPTGACCFGDGSCDVETEGDCAGLGGDYQGDDTDCSPNPCPQPAMGACCLGVSCTITTQAGCSGTYLGDGSVCDSDFDGANDCVDGCPQDPNKTDPGDCGCGTPDTDSDGDGTPDCIDGCPNDPDKTSPGDCGCGTPDTDSDGDGTPDCNDGCPSDPNKIDPGCLRLRHAGHRLRR